MKLERAYDTGFGGKFGLNSALIQIRSLAALMHTGMRAALRTRGRVFVGQRDISRSRSHKFEATATSI